MSIRRPEIKLREDIVDRPVSFFLSEMFFSNARNLVGRPNKDHKMRPFQSMMMFTIKPQVVNKHFVIQYFSNPTYINIFIPIITALQFVFQICNR
jgi:hypothetical protein